MYMEHSMVLGDGAIWLHLAEAEEISVNFSSDRDRISLTLGTLYQPFLPQRATVVDDGTTKLIQYLLVNRFHA